ncbi:hypothetical protein C1645_736472 [Glomus cerebriforme]|uniref:Uncharacterized protein n=1 Tax=Glomus cerebriforme TaxID=658196 RepID=A0A397T1V9_9GLOM|nr:hypothetical protein C1645_736472 [Glomus cerebriforme]
MTKVNIPSSRISSTSISVRKSTHKSPGSNNIIRKQETISGNHTTHIRKSTHRVEQLSSSKIRQRQQQQQTNPTPQKCQERSHNQVHVQKNSEGDLKVDLTLLKYVKEMLKKYIEEEPSKKLKNGECTWTEFEPYIREIHFPKFKKFLLDKGIQAPDVIISKSLKDLHISRRDLWNKKQRKLRELLSKEQLDNAEAQPPRSDGYVAYNRKVIHN